MWSKTHGGSSPLLPTVFLGQVVKRQTRSVQDAVLFKRGGSSPLLPTLGVQLRLGPDSHRDGRVLRLGRRGPRFETEHPDKLLFL